MTDEPLTTSQAAARLGCSPSTVLRYMRAGRLPSLAKLPGLRGAFLFAAGDVERLAAELAGPPEEGADVQQG